MNVFFQDELGRKIRVTNQTKGGYLVASSWSGGVYDGTWLPLTKKEQCHWTQRAMNRGIQMDAEETKFLREKLKELETENAKLKEQIERSEAIFARQTKRHSSLVDFLRGVADDIRSEIGR